MVIQATCLGMQYRTLTELATKMFVTSCKFTIGAWSTTGQHRVYRSLMVPDDSAQCSRQGEMEKFAHLREVDDIGQRLHAFGLSAGVPVPACQQDELPLMSSAGSGA